MKKFNYLWLVLAVMLITFSIAFAGAIIQKDEMDFRGKVIFTGEVPGLTGHAPVVVKHGFVSSTIAGATLTHITGTDVDIAAFGFSNGETVEWEIGGTTSASSSSKYIMIYVKDAPMATTTIAATVTGRFHIRCTLTAVTSTLSHALCITHHLNSTSSEFTDSFTAVQKDMSAGGTIKLQGIMTSTATSTVIDYARVKFNN